MVKCPIPPCCRIAGDSFDGAKFIYWSNIYFVIPKIKEVVVS